MMPVVRVSEATWERLKAHARPLEDSVDDVVGRALDALEASAGQAPAPQEASPAKRRTRRSGDKLPQREFRSALLKLLLELGGQARVTEIVPRLERVMAPRLKSGDYEPVSSGQVRWWNATCWERADLVREGLLSDRSPRGVWVLTEAGRRAARQ